jgi:predicted nuclease of predicted toxin-antitoxin system
MKRVLLDENLDWRLKNYFSDSFDVYSVPDLGWQAKKNGELLSSMDAEGLSYLLTSDQDLRHQRNLNRYNVVVVVISTFDNRLKNLSTRVSEIEAAIFNSHPDEGVILVDLRN